MSRKLLAAGIVGLMGASMRFGHQWPWWADLTCIALVAVWVAFAVKDDDQ